jgi:hypothetical protein
MHVAEDGVVLLRTPVSAKTIKKNKEISKVSTKCL